MFFPSSGCMQRGPSSMPTFSGATIVAASSPMSFEVRVGLPVPAVLMYLPGRMLTLQWHCKRAFRAENCAKICLSSADAKVAVGKTSDELYDA